MTDNVATVGHWVGLTHARPNYGKTDRRRDAQARAPSKCVYSRVVHICKYSIHSLGSRHSPLTRTKTRKFLRFFARKRGRPGSDFISAG